MVQSATLLRRSSYRYFLRHRWQLVLSVLGVALGVAVAVSVDLATGSAQRAFSLSTEALTGTATHQVIAGSEGLHEAAYRQLRVDLDIRAAAPIVEGHVALARDPARTLRLLGIDPLAEGLVRSYLAASLVDARAPDETSSLPLGELIGRPGAAAITADTAVSLGVARGGSIDVLVDGREEQLSMVAVAGIDHPAGRGGLRDVLVVDISTAQELLGMTGRLTRIDLRLEGSGSAVALERIVAALPPGAQIVAAGARTDATLQMTRAFRTNLRAMSLLAMVCGMFLIYNTMTFSVVQRRSLIGALRALGVTRVEIFRLVIGEAMLVGAIGTAVGLIAGVGLGRLLVDLVTRTINDLYFAVAVRELAVSPTSLGAGLLLGIGTTIAAALVPAREATRTAPRKALARSEIEARTRALTPRLASVAALLVALGAAAIAYPSTRLLPAFAGLFALLLGAALFTPLATRAMSDLLRRLVLRWFGPVGTLAARGVAAGLSRTAVAVAALMIAVAVVIGVGVMVASFRLTLVRWLDYTLQADLYVSSVSARGQAPELLLGASGRAALESHPAIVSLGTMRMVTLPAGSAELALIAIDSDGDVGSTYRLKAGDPDAWESFVAGDVLVSEPYASRNATEVGDDLVLRTEQGNRAFRVAGIYYSYASDRGAVLMHRAIYDRWWLDRGISGLSVVAHPDAALEALAADVRNAFPGQRVAVNTNRLLRERALRIFDRTFLITDVLRTLVILVAFIGVLSALMAIQLENTREYGILRATGLTPAQLWAMVTSQTGMVGFIAGVLAVPLGLGLAWVMVYVINKRSFGWTLQMHVPVEILLQAITLAMVAAILAGLLPAARIARLPPIAALREE
ncbi:MAG TPA: FtsX-like permease family protein [Acidobacteriota bacterium]|nr:FtsX-like permease family protein [Acidobacteriota bacterium]